MRKFAVLLTILALCSLGAQSVAWGYYDKGVEFSFGGLSTLSTGSIESGAIGVKKAMGPDQYMIGRVGFNYGQDKTDALANMSEPKMTDLGFSVTGILQHYIAPESHQVRPFIGGSAGVSYSMSKDEPSVTTSGNPAAGTTIEDKTTDIGFGAAAHMGAEYFFKPSMSLMAQYSLGFGFDSTKHTVDTANGSGGTTSGELKSTSWGLGPIMGAGMELTFYWGEM